MHRVLDFVAVQQCQATAELYDVHSFIGVNAVTNKAVFSLVAEQHWCRQHAQGPRLCCCATVSGYSRAVWGAKLHRCKCSPKQGCFQLVLQSSTGAGSMHRVLGFIAVQQC